MTCKFCGAEEGKTTENWWSCGSYIGTHLGGVPIEKPWITRSTKCKNRQIEQQDEHIGYYVQILRKLDLGQYILEEHIKETNDA